jgi:hypothetical protein
MGCLHCSKGRVRPKPLHPGLGNIRYFGRNFPGWLCHLIDYTFSQKETLLIS